MFGQLYKLQLIKFALSAATLLIVFLTTGCDSDDPNSVNGVDMRGTWFLFATHQDLAESHLAYQFRMTENRDHIFEAEAQRVIFKSPLWHPPPMVSGRVSFSGDQLVIEFTYPDDDEPTERVTGTIVNLDTLGASPRVVDLHYKGAIEGPLLRSPNPVPFDTDTVTLELLSN